MPNEVAVNTPAPDIAVDDFAGHPFRLSDYRGWKSVFLVFNRGFV